jgi:hypothetical protein
MVVQENKDLRPPLPPSQTDGSNAIEGYAPTRTTWVAGGEHPDQKRATLPNQVPMIMYSVLEIG